MKSCSVDRIEAFGSGAQQLTMVYSISEAASTIWRLVSTQKQNLKQSRKENEKSKKDELNA